MRKMANIKDVAAAAGVSVSTVSNVLNGRGRVSADTRAQVAGIAKKMGYHPAAAARNLRGKRSGILTLTVSTVGSTGQSLVGLDYFISIVGAATTTAFELGYSLIFSPRPGEQVDGVLVIDPVPGDPLIRQALQEGVPLVTTGRSGDVPEGNWVDVDVRAGARELLDHLSSNGAKSVSLLTGPHPTSFGDDVRSVYEDWCRSRDIRADIIMAQSDLSEQAAFDATVDRLDRQVRPDAVLCTFERLAIGALMAVNAAGLRVPDDILITACADSATMRNARPPITVLDLQPAEVARQAVSLLVDLIEGREVGPIQTKLPALLQPRRSSDRALQLS